MKIGDWLIHEKTRDTFKVEKIYGDDVLVDYHVDAGDIYPLSECRLATSAEIERELQRRDCMSVDRLWNIAELNDQGRYGEQAEGVINELIKEVERLKGI